MWKDNHPIGHIAERLLEASDTGNRERLLACCREAVTELRRPMRTTVEKELSELLSSIAEELISLLATQEGNDSSDSQLLLYHDLLFHVRAMADLVSR